MKKRIAFCIIFMLICTVFFNGCISSTYTKPEATTTATPEPTGTPTVVATVEPTALPAATDTVIPAETSTPLPVDTATPTAWPASAPIYTVSCTFTGLILNSTSTVITGISGNLTNVDTGDRIIGDVKSDTYQFSRVPSGPYDLAVDIQYTVYYTNNSTADLSTKITDSFGVNGNIDKIYPLY